jgi:hypothetical protein
MAFRRHKEDNLYFDRLEIEPAKTQDPITVLSVND